MSLYFSRHHLLTLIISINFLCLFNEAIAKDDSYLLQPNTHSVLIGVQENIANQVYSKALLELEKLLRLDPLKDYDRAIIYQAMGYAEDGRGNFSIASKHFLKALSLNALPEDATQQLTFTTAQILIFIDKTKEGLGYLDKWINKETEANAEAHILAATAYYKLEDYKKLISHVEKALPLSKEPPLNWYELLLAGYYETKMFQKSADLLEMIIRKHPGKTNFWLHLADIYQSMEQDHKALAIYELAYARNLLKQNGIRQLVNNYLYLQMPYKAATLIEKEMAVGGIKKNKELLTTLVDSWLLAQDADKAKSVLKEIDKRFNDEASRLRLGQLYIKSEEWEKAITVLEKNIGSINKALVSKSNLLFGIAQYHTENLNLATHAFTNALTDQSTKEQAQWWLQYLKDINESAQQG